MGTDYKTIFGPVPSRRLGRSLGIDLVPHKTCTLDCVYCESGKTTHLTLATGEYVPESQVKSELADYLSRDPDVDTITFSGSGEPLLHSGIGRIIRFIKDTYPEYSVAVLTNGTLLSNPAARKRILDADILKVSIDGVSNAVFKAINRPCEGLQLSDVVEGLKATRQVFKQQFWVEVFLVPGLNDTAEALARIRDLLRELAPDRVQLNALDRPGTEDWVTRADPKALQRTAAFLLNAEIIAHAGPEKELPERGKPLSNSDAETRILSTVRRRPCTVEDMSRQLGLRADTIQPYLTHLLRAGRIARADMPRGVFYRAVD